MNKGVLNREVISRKGGKIRVYNFDGERKEYVWR